MKALILTYDKQFGLAQLVIKKYHNFGIECLDFFVPINDEDTSRFFDFSKKITCIKSESDILSTMRNLIDQCDDNEWIYWSIDDRFPVGVNLTLFDKVFNSIISGQFDFAQGVKLINWREDLLNETSSSW